MLPRTLFFALVVVSFLAAPAATLAAQQIVIVRPPANGKTASGGFGGFSATPISPTAVLQSYMEAADSGATVGFALAIRGPAGWYNTRTRFGEISADSLQAGVVGQWWQVGERHYQLLYNGAQQTLALFDAVVDLRRSRVVLVTVSSDPGVKTTVVSGLPVVVSMSEPSSFSDIFLPRAPEVRAFAGIVARGP